MSARNRQQPGQIVRRGLRRTAAVKNGNNTNGKQLKRSNSNLTTFVP